MQLKEELSAAKKMAKECPFISITIGGFPIELFNLD
jgi:hypothetical protein